MHTHTTLQNNLQKRKGPCVNKKWEIFKFAEKSIDPHKGLAPHDHWCRRTCMKDWAVKIGFPPTSLFPPAELVWDDLTCHAVPCPPPPPPCSGCHLWRMLCLINGSVVMSSRQSGCQRSRCLRNLHSALSFHSRKTPPLQMLYDLKQRSEWWNQSHHLIQTLAFLSAGDELLFELQTAAACVTKWHMYVECVCPFCYCREGKNKTISTAKKTSRGGQCWHRKELTCVL